MHTVSSYTRKKKLLVIIIGMIIKKEREKKQIKKGNIPSLFMYFFF